MSSQQVTVLESSDQQNKNSVFAQIAFIVAHQHYWEEKEKLQMFFLSGHYPFSPDTSLRNICTGVHASSNVNVDKAKFVGCAILESMEGKSAADFSKLLH